MIYTLKNQYLSAKISALGAELQSLRDHKREYIWQAQPEYWAKHSPVLFPFVGEHKDGHYLYEGKRYDLPRHGFAFKKIFEVQQISEAEIVFLLEADAESWAIYPFDFRLEIRYRLLGPALQCHYKVSNPQADKPLYFSLGAHPAFDLPGDYHDYYLHFEQDELLQRWHTQQGLVSGERSALALQAKTLPLSYELFYQDALVLHDLQSERISVGHQKEGVLFDFEFQNYPYFGIWAAKNANFVCLEPWCGIADTPSHNQMLEDKLGIVPLAGHESFERSWAVAVRL
jgi:galactose mutarotase-like enzyme